MKTLSLIVTCVLMMTLAACLLAQNADPATGQDGVAPGQAGDAGTPAKPDANGNVTDPAQPPAPNPDGTVPGGMGGGVVPGGPGGIPREMPGGPQVIFPGEQAEQMATHLEMMRHMTATLFNARMAGVMAVFAIKDNPKLKAEDKIKLLSVQLEKTRTLGIRNAIRTALKDLYADIGQAEKATDQLKAMLEENDAALAKEKAAEEKP